MLKNQETIRDIEHHARLANSRGQGGIERKIDTLQHILFAVLDELSPEQLENVMNKIGNFE